MVGEHPDLPPSIFARDARGIAAHRRAVGIKSHGKDIAVETSHHRKVAEAGMSFAGRHHRPPVIGGGVNPRFDPRKVAGAVRPDRVDRSAAARRQLNTRVRDDAEAFVLRGLHHQERAGARAEIAAAFANEPLERRATIFAERRADVHARAAGHQQHVHTGKRARPHRRAVDELRLAVRRKRRQPGVRQHRPPRTNVRIDSYAQLLARSCFGFRPRIRQHANRHTGYQHQYFLHHVSSAFRKVPL